MAIDTDKNSYTVLFSVIMVIIVGSLLAFVATSLKPKISENVRIEKQQNILYAMGVHGNQGEGDVIFVPTDRVEEEFGNYITQQLVIVGAEPVEREDSYLIDVNTAFSHKKSGAPEAELPLFIGEKDGKTYYVLPMYGRGLWDAIWGYMSLDENMVIQGIYFDHKGETAGLGANIKERFFMDDFIGESIMDGNSYVGVAVSKTNNDPANVDKEDNAVDAIAGSTITGNGVNDMIKETLRYYRPYLETIRKK